jgi:hypothetical protein
VKEEGTSMKIQVTREHIVMGNCKKPNRCMIAVAIKEFDPTISYVSVRTNRITITKRRRDGGSIRQHFAVPTKVARAIIQFDAGQKVNPFSFNPTLIDEVKIPPVPPERFKSDSERTKKRRADLKAKGIQLPKYGPASRIAGI